MYKNVVGIRGYSSGWNNHTWTFFACAHFILKWCTGSHVLLTSCEGQTWKTKFYVYSGHGKDYGNKHNPIHATNTIYHEWSDRFVHFLVNYDVTFIYSVQKLCVTVGFQK